MITDVKHTVQDAMGWVGFTYGLLSAALAGPFNDDYNQWNQVYQCHGDPNGKVYVNVPWFCMCFDVDNHLVYARLSNRMGNTGWQVQIP